MKYKMILKKGIIITDDYKIDEFNTLRENLIDDLRKLDVDYPVDVYDEDNNKVMSFIPI